MDGYVRSNGMAGVQYTERNSQNVCCLFLGNVNTILYSMHGQEGNMNNATVQYSKCHCTVRSLYCAEV